MCYFVHKIILHCRVWGGDMVVQRGKCLQRLCSNYYHCYQGGRGSFMFMPPPSLFLSPSPSSSPLPSLLLTETVYQVAQAALECAV